MQHINKVKTFNYTKVHLASIVLILGLFNISLIIKLIPNTPTYIKKLIYPYTVTLSITFILLYSINILYHVSTIIKSYQEKKTLQKKILFTHLGFIGEAASLMLLYIISTIYTLILPFNNAIFIASSILSITSSLFVLEYASILLNTDIKKYKESKKTNQNTKYTIWSIINWTAALVISIINICYASSNYFMNYKFTDIFKIFLFTTYMMIITSLILIQNTKNNPSTSLDTKHTQLNVKDSKQISNLNN